jgi:hypothetical protein
VAGGRLGPSRAITLSGAYGFATPEFAKHSARRNIPFALRIVRRTAPFARRWMEAGMSKLLLVLLGATFVSIAASLSIVAAAVYIH